MIGKKGNQKLAKTVVESILTVSEAHYASDFSGRFSVSIKQNLAKRLTETVSHENQYPDTFKNPHLSGVSILRSGPSNGPGGYFSVRAAILRSGAPKK